MNNEEKVDMRARHWIKTAFTYQDIEGKLVRFSLPVDSINLIKGVGSMEFIVSDRGDIAIEIEAPKRDQPENRNETIVFSLIQRWADALVPRDSALSEFDCFVE